MTADTADTSSPTASITSSESESNTSSTRNCTTSTPEKNNNIHQYWSLPNILGEKKPTTTKATTEETKKTRRKKNQVEPTFFEGGKYEYELTKKPSTASVSSSYYTSGLGATTPPDSHLLLDDSADSSPPAVVVDSSDTTRTRTRTRTPNSSGNPNITTHQFTIPRTSTSSSSSSTNCNTTNNNSIDTNASTTTTTTTKSSGKKTKTFTYTHERNYKKNNKKNSKKKNNNTNSIDDNTTIKTTTTTTTKEATSTSYKQKRPLRVILTTTMIPVTKTIYLIRHAESEENRRLACLTRGWKGLKKLQLPTRNDVSGSLELLDVKAQIDSNVSDIGRNQISQLGERLSIDDFVKEKHIQLVAHSPLKRARQTSLGMLGCVTTTTTTNTNDNNKNKDFSAEGAKAPTVTRIIQLDILKERTPSEWLPHNFEGFTQRIASLETWLGEQPEDVIAIVGHSQYFKSMLGLDFKFGNCDVWEVQLDMTKIEDHEGVKEDVGVSPVEEKTMQIKEQLAKPFQKKEEGDKEEDNDSKSETDVIMDENVVVADDGSDVLDYSHAELPRGWRDLKRLYTYHKPNDTTSSNEVTSETNDV